MSGGVWMALEGVLMMSRWCLRVSGEASIPNLLAKTMLSYDTQILHFLSVRCIAQKCLMSWGVCIVSGSVLVRSDGVWKCINTKLVGKNV